ncbi:MAG: hypothetical protein EOO11_20615 [Chitinophagaceae bacterium]|nr:MAG: hypothetical protein EOO11_20615 [Chitinophagaceae bacterium]
MPRITPILFLLLLAAAPRAGAQQLAASGKATQEAHAALKRTLRTLDSAGVFTKAQQRTLKLLAPAHRAWFLVRPGLRVLESAAGPLFGHAGDAAFVVYDGKEGRLGYLLYSGADRRYGWLYNDFPVFNALTAAHCRYSAAESIDDRLSGELAYLKESLLKEPAGLSEYDFLQVGPFRKNENLLPREGCFSLYPDGRNFISKPVLALATGLVYNDWECLAWDASKKRFVLFYGQAFAD